MTISDRHYMQFAFQLAEACAGQTGANPAVGCVLVKDGRIVGIGSHLRQGCAHAEIHALTMAGEEARGATMYVTLEPCSHVGATPPCCEAVVKHGVRRAVVAAVDPNPKVAGRGIRYLREHGVEVSTGLMEEEDRRINEAFHAYIRRKTPFITMKSAVTLDGKTATRTLDSRWISGESSRRYVHELRHKNQAVLTGIGTVLADDPLLTSRLEVPTLQPIRIIVDSALRLPEQANVVRDRSAPTWVFTSEKADPYAMRKLEQRGIEVIPCGERQVDLKRMAAILGERQIASVLLEGGGRLNGAMLSAGLVDKLVLFIAPKFVGGDPEAPGLFRSFAVDRMNRALRLDRVSWRMFGNDLCLIGYPVYEREE